MTDEELAETEWVANVEFVPIGAWRRIKDNPALVTQMLDAMTVPMAQEIRDEVGEGWNIDRRAHHGPEMDEPGMGRGVRVVLRAWRFKPDA